MSLIEQGVALPAVESEPSQELSQTVGSLVMLEAFAPERLAQNREAFKLAGVEQDFPEADAIIGAFSPDEQAFIRKAGELSLVRGVVVSPVAERHGGLERLAKNYLKNRASHELDIIPREVDIITGARRDSWNSCGSVGADYNNNVGPEASMRVSLWLHNSKEYLLRNKTAAEQRQTVLEANAEQRQMVPKAAGEAPEVQFAGLTAIDYLMLHIMERVAGNHAERGVSRSARILPAVPLAEMEKRTGTQCVTATPDGRIVYGSRSSDIRDEFLTAHRAIQAVI